METSPLLSHLHTVTAVVMWSAPAAVLEKFQRKARDSGLELAGSKQIRMPMTSIRGRTKITSKLSL